MGHKIFIMKVIIIIIKYAFMIYLNIKLKKFNNVKASRYNFFYKITKDLLLIIGCRVLSIINADKYPVNLMVKI